MCQLTRVPGASLLPPHPGQAGHLLLLRPREQGHLVGSATRGPKSLNGQRPKVITTRRSKMGKSRAMGRAICTSRLHCTNWRRSVFPGLGDNESTGMLSEARRGRLGRFPSFWTCRENVSPFSGHVTVLIIVILPLCSLFASHSSVAPDLIPRMALVLKLAAVCYYYYYFVGGDRGHCDKFSAAQPIPSSATVS